MECGSKFGSHLPPVGSATSLIVAVLPLYVPTPPNHACLPVLSNANHRASSRLSGSTSTMRPWPLCEGSYHEPVKPASIAIGAGSADGAASAWANVEMI